MITLVLNSREKNMQSPHIAYKWHIFYLVAFTQYLSDVLYTEDLETYSVGYFLWGTKVNYPEGSSVTCISEFLLLSLKT